MNYTSLEDAYGGAFPQRVPVQHTRKDAQDTSAAPFTSLIRKSQQSIQKNQSTVDAVKGSLNIDESEPVEGFAVKPPPTPPPVKERMRVRETFATSGPTSGPTLETESEKISRILRLIEQNKTGYERPATQDMVLYIFTGVFFLFTFDTFVMLGKSMRGK
jgi:hypothetical protein